MGKLTIYAYKENDFTGRAGDYTVNINPNTFTHNQTSNYKTTASEGNPAVETKFNSQAPGTVSFKIQLDGTGAIKDGLKDVPAEIRKITNLLYKFQGGTHRPYFLRIVWGKFYFGCVLNSLNITYQLFKPDGTALRAEIDLTFTGYVSPKLAAKVADAQSSDLTHVYEVKSGDTLPLICDTYYGKPDYYIQVAKANKLTHFRRLKPGSKIILPPLVS